MNSDPTGNCTLVGICVAINVENTLRDMYNGALMGGFMSFVDAMAAGETDPYALLNAFGNGAVDGLVSSALTVSLTSIRNLGCLAPTLSTLSSFALMALSAQSTFDALQGAVESLLAGKYEQAVFRGIPSINQRNIEKQNSRGKNHGSYSNALYGLAQTN